MKKIILNTGKLKLKKESIGNLLNKETMKQVMGGLTQQSSPYANCTAGCPSLAPQCGIGQQTIGCNPSAGCTNTGCTVGTCVSVQGMLSCAMTCGV